jgi:hypothetical protein
MLAVLAVVIFLFEPSFGDGQLTVFGAIAAVPVAGVRQPSIRRETLNRRNSDADLPVGCSLRAADTGCCRVAVASGDAAGQARTRHQPPVLGGGRATAGLTLELVLMFGNNRVYEIGIHETASSGLRARMIAADACWWTW